MKIACIIGAGHSFMAGIPLGDRLFTTGRSLYRRNNKARHHISSVRRSFKKWRQDFPNCHAEEYLSHLYNNIFTDVPFEWVIEYLCVVIGSYGRHGYDTLFSAEFGNFFLGPPRDLYIRQFWELILEFEPVPLIVTFNYDLLIERILGSPPIQVSHVRGFYYGGLPRPQYVIVRSKPKLDHVILDNGIPIYKLHGSLNWIVETHDILVYADARPAFRDKRKCAIVPPVCDKDIPDWLKKIWLSVEKELIESDTWIIVGYSMPAYDIAARRLLTDASKDKLKRVILLDPNSKILYSRYKSVLRNIHIECLEGIPDGLQDLRRMLCESKSNEKN